MVGKISLYQGTDLWDPELLRSNSEGRFWGNPDLVLLLLPFVEVDTTLALASLHPLTRDLLRRRFIWRQLLERTKMTQKRLLACKSLEEYCDTMLDMGKEAEALKSLLDALNPLEEMDDLETWRTSKRSMTSLSTRRCPSRSWKLARFSWMSRVWPSSFTTVSRGKFKYFLSQRPLVAKSGRDWPRG